MGLPKPMTPLLLTVDIAHPPRSQERAEHELTEAWRHVRNSPTLRVLKIVHGHGSSGKGGTLRTVARNWAYRHRSRFLRIIDGERYSPFDPDTRDLLQGVGDFPDGDRGVDNPGILIIWVK